MGKDGDVSVKKSDFYSTLEIWSDHYINHREDRNEDDREAVILQIEHADGCNYIVEGVRA